MSLTKSPQATVVLLVSFLQAWAPHWIWLFYFWGFQPLKPRLRRHHAKCTETTRWQKHTAQEKHLQAEGFSSLPVLADVGEELLIIDWFSDPCLLLFSSSPNCNPGRHSPKGSSSALSGWVASKSVLLDPVSGSARRQSLWVSFNLPSKLEESPKYAPDCEL